jgi:hypothetical protein
MRFSKTTPAARSNSAATNSGNNTNNGRRVRLRRRRRPEFVFGLVPLVSLLERRAAGVVLLNRIAWPP